jgi:hypothetical protein
VDGPLADALHLGELGEERGLVHRGDGGLGELPCGELTGEVVQVRSLAAGDADGAEVGVCEREDRGGGDCVRGGEEREESGVDGIGGGRRELLVEDGARERVECGEGCGGGEGGGLVEDMTTDRSGSAAWRWRNAASEESAGSGGGTVVVVVVRGLLAGFLTILRERKYILTLRSLVPPGGGAAQETGSSPVVPLAWTEGGGGRRSKQLKVREK